MLYGRAMPQTSRLWCRFDGGLRGAAKLVPGSFASSTGLRESQGISAALGGISASSTSVECVAPPVVATGGYNVSACTCAHARMHMRTCTHAHMHAGAHARRRTCMHAYSASESGGHDCSASAAVRMHPCMHPCVHTCMHTCIGEHLRERRSRLLGEHGAVCLRNACARDQPAAHQGSRPGRHESVHPIGQRLPPPGRRRHGVLQV